MSRSLSRWQALVLGGSVLAALALAVFGIFTVGSQQWLWGKTFHVEVAFPQIRGVEPGTRVRVLGREAGEVESIQLPDKANGPVKLRLRLAGDVRNLIREDASAQIVAEGMIGGKVIEIHPGSDKSPSVKDDAAIASRPGVEISDLLAQVNSTLQDLRKGEGSLGKLIKDEDAYRELVELLREGRGTISSLKRNSDAIKEMPLVRNYVLDPYKELVRPDCERNRKCFAEGELFEPGSAVLTADGRKRLDEVAPWVVGLKHKGSAVVVASFAAPGLDRDVARILTQKQSEAVCDYLTGNYSIQKLGWFSWRKVTPLGCGSDPSPMPESEKLPPARVEVVVFVPQG